MSLGDGDITFENDNEQPKQDEVPDESSGDDLNMKTVVFASAPIIREVSYKNKNIRDEYRTIKQVSCFTPEYVINAAKRRLVNEDSICGKQTYDFAGLLDKLSFDVVYELSSLEPLVQEQLLRDNMGTEYQQIIDAYKSEYEEPFDISNFYAYLRQMSEMYNEGFIIKTGNKEDDGKTLSDGSRIEYDEGICEGAKVIHNNTMYDYSL